MPYIGSIQSQSNVISQPTEEELVRQLATQTGIEEILAREHLASNHWNLEKAIQGYKCLVEMEKTPRKERKKGLKETGRGFSVSNMELVQKARQQLSLEERKAKDEQFEVFDKSSRKNFVLPDISQFNRDLANFIKEDIISITTLQALTSAGCLNWWAEIGACRKLFPLSTVGDGNCLLHAASLGMWGFHDRMLTLRKSLYQLSQHPLSKKSLKRRWKYYLWQENLKCGGLTYSRDEWEDEWNAVVKLASDRPRRLEGGMRSRRISRQLSFRSSAEVGGAVANLREGESLDSLESIHVYALANLLCRPIIVLAEEMLKDGAGNDVAPIPFGGIYLPFERKPDLCSKYPLVLAYDASHFSALVPADGEVYNKGEKLSNSIPLMNSRFELLPLRFCIDPGSTWDLVQDDSVKEEKSELSFQENLNFLKQYLEVVKVRFDNPEDKLSKYERNDSVKEAMLLACKLNLSERPKHYQEMMDKYISDAKRRFADLFRKVKCAVKSCRNPAAPDLLGYCEECFDQKSRISKLSRYIDPAPPHDSVRGAISEEKASTDGLVARSVASHDNQFGTIRHDDKYLPMSQNNPVVQDRIIPITDARRTSEDDEYRNIGTNCRRPGCKFYGSEQTAGFCSGCYRRYKESGG